MSRAPHRGRNRGMTLIEVLLASLILSVGLATLLTATSRCLMIMRRAGEYQRAQWALNRGMLEHPILTTKNIEDQTVDGEDYDGYVFSRTVAAGEAAADDEDKDGLFVIRSRITWKSGSHDQVEEVVQMLYRKPEKSTP